MKDAEDYAAKLSQIRTELHALNNWVDARLDDLAQVVSGNTNTGNPDGRHVSDLQAIIWHQKDVTEYLIDLLTD